MSLSDHLKNKNSPVRQFLETNFSNHRAFLSVARRRMRQSETLLPDNDIGYSYPTIGTAIDYRLRYYFGITAIEDFVAYETARFLTERQEIDPRNHEIGYHLTSNEKYGQNVIIFDRKTGKQLYDYWCTGRPEGAGDTFTGWPAADALDYDYMEFWNSVPEFLSSGFDDGYPLKKEYKEFFESLDALVVEICPVGRELNKEQEENLNRYCFVLALLEQIFRAGPRISSPLLTRNFKNVDELLDLSSSNCITDMCSLSWKFYENFNQFLSYPHILNPNFEGSPAVGGADADLIVDGTLIDIKTTKKREIDRDWLWQLMGYALLDYSDSRKIRGIGLYLTRQGLYFRWSMKEVLAFLYKGKPKNLEQLRGEFKEIVNSSSAVSSITN